MSDSPPSSPGDPVTTPVDLSADMELKQRVQTVIDESINPAIAMHGGFITLLDVKETVAYVQMGGGCQGCGAAAMTLKHGVEQLLAEEVPEVTEVLDTTDHAAGGNPFYAPTTK